MIMVKVRLFLPSKHPALAKIIAKPIPSMPRPTHPDPSFLSALALAQLLH
jgi:hypothetical protein